VGMQDARPDARPGWTAEGGIIKVSPFRAGGETSHGNSNYELFSAVQLEQYHSTNNGENGD